MLAICINIQNYPPQTNFLKFVNPFLENVRRFKKIMSYIIRLMMFHVYIEKKF